MTERVPRRHEAGAEDPEFAPDSFVETEAAIKNQFEAAARKARNFARLFVAERRERQTVNPPAAGTAVSGGVRQKLSNELSLKGKKLAPFLFDAGRPVHFKKIARDLYDRDPDLRVLETIKTAVKRLNEKLSEKQLGTVRSKDKVLFVWEQFPDKSGTDLGTHLSPS